MLAVLQCCFRNENIKMRTVRLMVSPELLSLQHLSLIRVLLLLLMTHGHIPCQHYFNPTSDLDLLAVRKKMVVSLQCKLIFLLFLSLLEKASEVTFSDTASSDAGSQGVPLAPKKRRPGILAIEGIPSGDYLQHRMSLYSYMSQVNSQYAKGKFSYTNLTGCKVPETLAVYKPNRPAPSNTCWRGLP